MRVWVVARVIDTMYQLIYSSAQTQVWRIDFSYRNIHEYKGRSKGRAWGILRTFSMLRIMVRMLPHAMPQAMPQACSQFTT